MINTPVYLDNHATTRVDSRVLDEMLPYFTEIYGNASSRAHEFGWKASAAVDLARTRTARLIKSETREIFFTSGATESINLALKGVAEAYALKKNHIITTKAEHKAVLDTCSTLEEKGFTVTYLDVDKFGLCDPKKIEKAITDKTLLVSVIFVNNEIGSINDIEYIGAMCRERGVIFHTDATQAAGKLPIDVDKMNIDMLNFSSHKMYGPKGAGALFVKKKSPKIRIVPQIDGGGHERGRRSGTLNVPGIVGMGKACEICENEMVDEAKRIKNMRDRLFEGIVSNLDNVYLNGHPEKRTEGNLNLSFDFVNAESIMCAAKEIAVSSGSACSSAAVEPSHVLKAIGLDKDRIHSSIRFGIGRFNTEEEIDYTINRICKVVKELREISPSYRLNKEKTSDIEIL